jgi:hypothetical protein
VFLVASDFNAGKLNPSTCEFQISLTVAPAWAFLMHVMLERSLHP